MQLRISLARMFGRGFGEGSSGIFPRNRGENERQRQRETDSVSE